MHHKFYLCLRYTFIFKCPLYLEEMEFFMVLRLLEYPLQAKPCRVAVCLYVERLKAVDHLKVRRLHNYELLAASAMWKTALACAARKDLHVLSKHELTVVSISFCGND